MIIVRNIIDILDRNVSCMFHLFVELSYLVVSDNLYLVKIFSIPDTNSGTKIQDREQIFFVRLNNFT